MKFRCLKSAYRWDTLSYWTVYAMLYQLICRLNNDLPRLALCFSERFSLLTNILALCTIMDEFIYFSPLSYEDEAFSAHAHQLSFVKVQTADFEILTHDASACLQLRTQIRLDNTSSQMTSGLTTEIDSNFLGSTVSHTSPTSSLTKATPTRGQMSPLETVLAEIEGFDYKSIQRFGSAYVGLKTKYLSPLQESRPAFGSRNRIFSGPAPLSSHASGAKSSSR
jgi:hypothetical protein